MFVFRSLLCRPLPVDIGRCTCIIVKEKAVDGINGGSVYTLYTNVCNFGYSNSLTSQLDYNVVDLCLITFLFL